MNAFARCALLCFVVLAPAGGGQPSHRGAPAYRQLVADYRHRDAGSIRSVLTFSEGDVHSSVAEAIDSSTNWTAIDLRAAAMLHTDACGQLFASGQSDAAVRHLDAATRLIDAATLRDNLSRRFASIWYANMPRMLSRLGARARAGQLLEHGRSVVPNSDAERALHKGLDFENAACELDDNRMVELFGMQSSAPLRAAATSFEQALRLDPSLHTAALHLGRARLLQGSLDKARQNLDVATHSALASERYLALLFLGAIAEQAGRLDDAEARYRAAVSEFKWGQSGPLALARLLSRTNREQDAQEVIAAFLAGDGPTMEPLWTFIARPEQEPLPLLDLLRAEIWQ